MQDSLKSANSLTPENLVREAPVIIGRIIEHMQASLARDANLPNIPYCALLVKLGANDLTREFVEGFNAGCATLKQKPPSPTSMLTLELVLTDAPDPAVAILRESSAVFDQLSANAKALGVTGINAYGKDMFLVPLREALVKARIDEASAVHLMPYACRALEVELLALYRRVNAQMKSGQ